MAGTILSLFDHSGNWSRPYREAGYNVIQVDLATCADVRLMKNPGLVQGILAAPPCTMFARSGQWARKIERELGTFDAKMIEALSCVDAVFRFVAICKPQWYAIENPIGTLRRFIGDYRLKFDPCDYAMWNPINPQDDAYTKKTCLWGNYALPQRRPVEPVRICDAGSWLMRLSGQGKRTKELRSKTPLGFAYAFFDANP